jgi:hypothetical protein
MMAGTLGALSATQSGILQEISTLAHRMYIFQLMALERSTHIIQLDM